MTFILIAVLIGFNGGGTTSLSVEFHSQKACLDALTVLATKVNTSGSNLRAGGVLQCSPKG